MNPASEFRLVMVTAPNITVARRLATLALKEKLAACVNLVPKIESHYWWNGQLESSAEVLMMLKTSHAKTSQLEKLVISNHPYETPEIITLEWKEGNEKYLSWIAASAGLAPQQKHGMAPKL
jgi:periplasmic divalent cation tolerance protein